MKSIKFQPTLPHGERPGVGALALRQAVSTHAPTWGATELLSWSKYLNMSFNPRSHMGSDAGVGALALRQAVSTHAPTWGATREWRPVYARAAFQPTLPHGERLHRAWLCLFVKMFQPTLPHGERRRFRAESVSNKGFNPRSHMGSDPDLTFISN